QGSKPNSSPAQRGRVGWGMDGFPISVGAADGARGIPSIPHPASPSSKGRSRAPSHFFEDFYFAAEHRDALMAARLIEEIRRTGADRVALVTGGFHSAGIDDRLVQEGFSTVSAVPRLTHADPSKGSAYLSEFLQEKTPLEKLVEGHRLFVAPQQWT